MIHTNLPIYKKGYDLLSLAADVQLNMPRTFKQSLGKRVHDECVDRSNSKWFYGDIGFVLKNPELLDFAPMKGSLGLFNVKRINK